MYNVVGQVGFVRVGKIRRQKAEPTGVGRAEADPRKTVVGCPKPSWVSDFNQTEFSLRPSGAEGIGNDPAERHLVISSTTLSVVDIFSRLVSLN